MYPHPSHIAGNAFLRKINKASDYPQIGRSIVENVGFRFNNYCSLNNSY